MILAFIWGAALTPVTLILLGIWQQEKVVRVLVRWRYRFLGEPDQDGWQAKANFGRKES